MPDRTLAELQHRNRLRAQVYRLVPQVRSLGDRVLAELLLELALDTPDTERLVGALRRYSGLRRDVPVAAGGYRLPPPPLWIVGGRAA